MRSTDVTSVQFFASFDREQLEMIRRALAHIFRDPHIFRPKEDGGNEEDQACIEAVVSARNSE